ncbi:MAG: 8-oxo-dGTP diphosphatase [bacterium]|nr:8-oxo-dGTP diphosphatase [bacterium]
MSRKLFTLVLVHQGQNILLAVKKRGFGAGRWNGLGGKVQPDEPIETAAKREAFEEAGIKIEKMEKVGLIDFIFKDNPEIMEVHIFRADTFKGEPVETEEMRPRWFETSAIPFDEMWPDDKHWFPLFLAGKKFKGTFSFDLEENIVGQELKEVENI